MSQQITEAEKQRTQQVWESLMRDVQPYRDSLASWSVEFDSEKWYAQNRVMPDAPEDYKKILDDLAAVEKLITSEKYAGVKGYFGPDDDILHRPQHWLEICKARVEITQRVVKRELSRILRPQILPVQLMAERVRDFSGWGLSEDGLAVVMGNREPIRKRTLEKASALFAAVGMSMEGTQVPELEKACDDLVKAAEEWAPKAKRENSATIASINAPLKARWASGAWRNRKILAINTASASWNVTRNAAGTPLYRTCNVSVLFEIPGYAYWIEYNGQVRENYQGGGAYSFVTSNVAPEYRILTKRTK
jgi:hypothetical protein